MTSLYHLYNEYLSLDYHQFAHIYSPPTVHVIPLTAIFAYFAMMYFLPKVVPKEGFGNLRTATNQKSAEKWKMLYFLWNMFLCVLSVMMLLGVGVPVIHYIFTHGGLWHGTWNVICNIDGEASYLTDAKIPLVFWGWLFSCSKYFELFDTVLLILKNPGRKILLLHWLHHWSVLLITWYIGYYRIPVGWLYLIVNALVHSFMYYYYAMTEIGQRPSWNFYLTLGQTLQMVLGTVINVAWFYGYLHSDEYHCVCQRGCGRMFLGIGAMYITYFVLFTKFFMEKYGILGGKKNEEPAKGSGKTLQAQGKKARKLE